jgi:hypothetical protein
LFVRLALTVELNSRLSVTPEAGSTHEPLVMSALDANGPYSLNITVPTVGPPDGKYPPLIVAVSLIVDPRAAVAVACVLIPGSQVPIGITGWRMVSL